MEQTSQFCCFPQCVVFGDEKSSARLRVIGMTAYWHGFTNRRRAEKLSKKLSEKSHGKAKTQIFAQRKQRREKRNASL
jgi:hypothetical protein